MSALPFLIIETGHPVSGMKRYGRFPHWIRVAAGLAERETVVIDVASGDRLPDRRGFAGTLISGSAAFVTDRADWSERSAEWLRDAAHAGMPLLGICYGHQLIAHALGGQVDYNPAGRESGTIALELHPPAHEDPLFAGLPPQFPAHATHLQTVLRAPDGAVVLARSPQDQCHAFRWGQSTWGCSSTPSSPPTICAAMCARGRTASPATAAAPAPWPARSAPHRWRASCCGASSTTHVACKLWPAIPPRTRKSSDNPHSPGGPVRIDPEWE